MGQMTAIFVKKMWLHAIIKHKLTLKLLNILRQNYIESNLFELN